MGRKTGFLGFSYCIVYALRMALCAIDIVLDYLFGFTIRHGSLNERFMSKSYEYSAQLVDVLAWGTHSYLLTVPNNYVVRHNKYIHPNYVLQHDNITLMGITPTQAFFCVSDAEVDVQNIKAEPFLMIAQQNFAKQLIFMPHSSFNQLASEIGEVPSHKRLTFVNMTSRCGSTLLGQIIAQTPNTRVLSEPWSFVNISYLLNCKQITKAEFKTLLNNIVHIMCNWELNKDIEHVFIKTTCLMAPAYPQLKEMFPCAKFIFNTRNFKSTLESQMQLIMAQPTIVILTGELTKWILDRLAIPHDDQFLNDLHKEWKLRGKFDFNDDVTKLALGYGAQISEFLRHREDYHLIVLYEDIKTDPTYICKQLLEVCEVSKEHISRALDALKFDAQKGTFGKRGAKPTLKPELLVVADNLFKECKLPVNCRTSAKDFKNFIFNGSYSMLTKYDPPSEIYDRVFADVKHISFLESIRILKK